MKYTLRSPSGWTLARWNTTPPAELDSVPNLDPFAPWQLVTEDGTSHDVPVLYYQDGPPIDGLGFTAVRTVAVGLYVMGQRCNISQDARVLFGYDKDPARFPFPDAIPGDYWLDPNWDGFTGLPINWRTYPVLQDDAWRTCPTPFA